jgi:hypothetical protein
MESKYEVSGTFLRQSINEMKKIHTGAYSEIKHGKKSFLEEKAEQYFDLFLQDKLDVKSDDMKTFSQYIDTLSVGTKKEELLDKLQAKADFDVRGFLYEDSKSWWQKLLNEEKYSMSSEEMNKKIKKFVQAKQRLEDSGYYSSSATRTVDKLSFEAEEYINAYNKGFFSPKAEDAETFGSYIKTMGNFYEGSPAATAIENLKENKGVLPPEPKSKKFSFKFNLKKIKYALGGAALTAVMSIGAWFGLGGNNKKQDAPKGKQPVVNIITKLSMPKMGMPEAFDYSLDKFIAKKNVNTAPTVEVSASAGDDFYEVRLNRFTTKSKKEAMQKALAAQMEKGIISLPQNVSPSRFLYTKLVYQKYGFKDIANEFNQALKADKTLSAETQAKLYDYVNKAGAKGVGVRNMAYKQHYGQQNKAQKNLAQVMRENRANLR